MVNVDLNLKVGVTERVGVPLLHTLQ